MVGVLCLFIKAVFDLLAKNGNYMEYSFSSCFLLLLAYEEDSNPLILQGRKMSPRETNWFVQDPAVPPGSEVSWLRDNPLVTSECKQGTVKNSKEDNCRHLFILEGFSNPANSLVIQTETC